MQKTKFTFHCNAAIVAFLGGAAALSVFGTNGASAQTRNKTVTASATAVPASVKAGGAGVLTVALQIKEGFHIYSAAPGSPDFIPTTATGDKASGIVWGKAQFAPAQSVTMAAISPKPVMVYESKTVVKLPYTVAKTAKPGKITLKATVECQACNDSVCFPPQSLPVSAEVTVR